MAEQIQALILCAGEGRRWRRHFGVPKQLVRVGGRPILHRTVDLLRGEGVTEIAVVANTDEFAVEGCRLLQPEHSRWTVETLLSTAELWAPRTAVLLGDVWFTPATLRRLVEARQSLCFLGQEDGGTGAEIFGLSFDEAGGVCLAAHLRAVREMAAASGQGRLADLLSLMRGSQRVLATGAEPQALLHPVNDGTQDFDTPADYETWLARYEAAGISN